MGLFILPLAFLIVWIISQMQGKKADKESIEYDKDQKRRLRLK